MKWFEIKDVCVGFDASGIEEGDEHLHEWKHTSENLYKAVEKLEGSSVHCPHCDTDVILSDTPTDLCPNCGEVITACSLCRVSDRTKCGDCGNGLNFRSY